MESNKRMQAAAGARMLAVALVHVTAVIASGRLHHENLVASMFSGEKAGRPEQGLRSGWHSIGWLTLLGVAAFWWLQWKNVLTPTRSASCTRPSLST